MRELKFRAWLVPYRQSDGKPSKRNKPYYDYFDLWNEYGDDTWFNGASVECFEQYTGLKDKNGKEIYEGDIVRWSFKVDRNSELTYTADAVKWESYAEEEWPYSTISGFTLPESEDGYEVIGNIHENPELLEEEE